MGLCSSDWRQLRVVASSECWHYCLQGYQSQNMWREQHREGDTVGLFRFITEGNWKMVGTCLFGKISAGSSEVRVSGAIIPQCSLVLDYQLDQKELWKSCLGEANHAKTTLYRDILYGKDEDRWDFLISQLLSACPPSGVRTMLYSGHRTPGHPQKTCSV